MRFLLAAGILAAAVTDENPWQPLEVGSTWTYVRSRQGRNPREVTIEVKEARAAAFVIDGPYFMHDNMFEQVLCWTDEKGVWVRRLDKRAPEDEALQVLKTPPEKGSWEIVVSDTVRKTEKTWTLECLGEESITVPAGTFTTVKVRWTLARGLYGDLWVAKDIGVVRRQIIEGSHEECLLELKSFEKAKK